MTGGVRSWMGLLVPILRSCKHSSLQRAVLPTVMLVLQGMWRQSGALRVSPVALRPVCSCVTATAC